MADDVSATASRMTEPETKPALTKGVWRCACYTSPRWDVNWHRWRSGIVGRSPHDSPPRSFDGVLSVGPLRWRIYREHPWPTYEGISGLKVCPSCGARLGRPHLSYCRNLRNG